MVGSRFLCVDSDYVQSPKVEGRITISGAPHRVRERMTQAMASSMDAVPGAGSGMNRIFGFIVGHRSCAIQLPGNRKTRLHRGHEWRDRGRRERRHAADVDLAEDEALCGVGTALAEHEVAVPQQG